MDIQRQDTPDLQTVADLIEDIKFAMFTTEEPDGTLRSRPMATMQMESNGDLWFFTGESSPKVAEAEGHRQVNLSYSRIDKQDYVSISGLVDVVHDKQKMASLWTPWIKPWFPDGLDDPDLVLLRVRITEAEYWDAPGNTVKRMYGLAKGILTGNTDALGDNRKVSM